MSPDPVDSTLDVVEQILGDMGLELSSTAPLVRQEPGDPAALLDGAAQFARFIGQFSIRSSCIPYTLDAVRGLTALEFCEMYARESFPEVPDRPLGDPAYGPGAVAHRARATFAIERFPICFVLGCPRSGTTLFRSMLNTHPALWAPGEPHLAQFDTMADRAAGLTPHLRRSFEPEAAARFAEPPIVFADRLRGWEEGSRPTTEVYRDLHEADPRSSIVDKTPPYSAWREDIDWIAYHFAEARFVHVVRNPHDVVRSFVRMQLHKVATEPSPPGTNPYQLAERAWFRHNTNIVAALGDIPPGRAATVRYEDLMADPEPTLMRVCDLLDVTYEPSMADPYAGIDGTVAIGAGDPRVNLLTRIEPRAAAGAFYPLSAPSERLASTFGYLADGE